MAVRSIVSSFCDVIIGCYHINVIHTSRAKFINSGMRGIVVLPGIVKNGMNEEKSK